MIPIGCVERQMDAPVASRRPAEMLMPSRRAAPRAPTEQHQTNSPTRFDYQRLLVGVLYLIILLMICMVVGHLRSRIAGPRHDRPAPPSRRHEPDAIPPVRAPAPG